MHNFVRKCICELLFREGSELSNVIFPGIVPACSYCRSINFFKIVFSMSFHSQKDSDLYKIKTHCIKLHPHVYLYSQVDSRHLNQEEMLSWPIPTFSCVASKGQCKLGQILR